MLFQTWLEQFPVLNDDESYGLSLMLEARNKAVEPAADVVDTTSIVATRSRTARNLDAFLKDRPASVTKLDLLRQKNIRVMSEVGVCLFVRGDTEHPRCV